METEQRAPRPRPKTGGRIALLWQTRWLGVAFIVVLLVVWEIAAASGRMPSHELSAHERGTRDLVGA